MYLSLFAHIDIAENAPYISESKREISMFELNSIGLYWQFLNIVYIHIVCVEAFNVSNST